MKGISPILASVLLIAFTVGLATLVFGFLSTTVRETTTTISNKTSTAVECSAASINIEDVFVSGVGVSKTVRVIAKNTGFADSMVIQGAEVFNASGSNFTAAGLPVTNFNKGSILTLTFSGVSLGSTCPQGFSKAVITTSCGGISDTFDGTPKCG